MTIDSLNESTAVIETRLAHGVHRVATTLLAEAAVRPSVPLSALAQLRDFLVVNLRHHHETEDDDLWPRIVAAAPATAHELDALTEEHERLDAALDRLAATDLGHGEGATSEGIRAALHDAAVAVRDTVHDHLTHEEPILFPALRDHVSPAEWKDFAQRVISTTPPVAGHLMVGFLDEVGTPAEVELVLAGLPEPVRPLLPAMRTQATDDLKILRGTGS
ncbi:hemerythrin domain-containing protein [Streptomyces sp. NBC_01724]|uniref:hemerythrin domain-containing protein n=1 Tax=unclassified Streptomyces TaxID=2593676 RepID=UPI0028C456C7|nr:MULTISPECIES: hemerythrin domain-containing protein [unclassified Streptomyces]WNO62335.1 hemerythrin domain-containing protein [Streptomyces sp. AM2-3-1]WNO69611.1 hemerythrin domain-containing protein [Streptomyces sp. AM2-3-1]WTE49302.1 hemerythrin domain-containing protein [Streptomyces sp. NBC_01620]